LAIGDLETELAGEFDQHPQAAILRSAPGLGPILAARFLAEIGDDPARFTDPNSLRAFSGTAPLTIASGRSRYVKARKVRNKRLGDACHWWAFAMAHQIPGRPRTLRQTPSAGDHHNAAQPRQQASRPPVVVPWQTTSSGTTTGWATPNQHANPVAA
jgi:hypothetical protein